MALNRSSRSVIFMYTALGVELLNRTAHVAVGELLDHFLQSRILLPHDVVKPCSLNPGVLELLIRSAGVDGLVLPHITDQQHAIFWVETLQERVHLLRAR